MKLLAFTSVIVGFACLAFAILRFIYPHGVSVWAPPPVTPPGMHDYAGTTIVFSGAGQAVASVTGVVLVTAGLGAHRRAVHNQALLWTGPRRVVILFLFHVLPARRVARHRTSSVIPPDAARLSERFRR